MCSCHSLESNWVVCSLFGFVLIFDSLWFVILESNWVVLFLGLFSIFTQFFFKSNWVVLFLGLVFCSRVFNSGPVI